MTTNRSFDSRSSTPAGWFPERGRLRYWDGTAWTDQVMPLPPLPPPARKKGGCVAAVFKAWLVMVAVTAVIGAIGFAMGGGRGDTDDSTDAETPTTASPWAEVEPFEATFTGMRLTSPGSVVISFSVANPGTEPIRVMCMITAVSPMGEGYDSVGMIELDEPYERQFHEKEVIITNDSAAWTNSVYIECS